MNVTFNAGNESASGYLATPAGGTGAGVVILHAWWGLNEFFKDFCDRLAGEGFVAFAPDLFGDRTAATVGAAQALIDSLAFERVSQAVQGGFDFLHDHPAVEGAGFGVVGFSFGAAWSLHLATTYRPDDIAAVVTFYGLDGSIESEAFARSRAAFLGHFAPEDEWEEIDAVRATKAQIRAAGREITFHEYPGAGHWFVEQNRPDAYNAEAAALAWERTVAFLREHLAPR